MYSMVLMLAMASASDTATLGRGGCMGCCGGYSSCMGCCGGYSSCMGCCGGGKLGGMLGGFFGGRKHSSCHGCCGGSCYGSCHGFACSGGSCHGCYGGAAAPAHAAPVYGAPVAPAMPAPGGMKMEMAPEKKAEAEAPAKIVVSLPADAKLTVDGVATKATSAERTFVTPALPAGKTFAYTLTAEVVVDGKTIVATEEVTVKAGETTTVKLAPAAVAVAAK